MKRNLLATLPLLLLSWIYNVCSGQEVIHNTLPPGYDPHYDKIIPDKVFEIGLPLLLIFLLSNAVVNILKTRAENRLKEKVLDKQVSEATLVALFSEDKSMAKYSYLKWFLILASLGISFIVIMMLAESPVSPNQGYMSLGIIAMTMSVAFLVYFMIIRNK